MNFFTEIAAKIVNCIGPASLLHFGCAHGLLVENLRDRGVDAYGLAISENPAVQVLPFLQKGALLDPLPRRYDLIVCLDVFEKLSPVEADQVVQNFAQATDDILFSSNPTDFIDPSHRNVQAPPYWAALFARHGFQHDLEFDASFINGWAMRLRKTTGPLADLVLAYERQFWKANRQLEALRDLFLGSQPQPQPSKAEGEEAAGWPQPRQTLQTRLPLTGPNSERVASELAELRRGQALSEQELLRQQQRAERALQLFKMAQARFRQMEKERDLQMLAVERNRAEAEQQLADLKYQVEQTGQEIRRYQGQIYRLENELRSLQTNRVGRATTRITRLVRDSLHLVRHSLPGPFEGSIDIPTPEGVIEDTLHLAGWAYSRAAHVTEVLVLLDDKFLGQAEYGLPRPDVIKNRPWQPVLHCGFEAELKLEAGLFPTGAYTLTVEVRDLKGNHQKILRPVEIIKQSEKSGGPQGNETIS